MSVRHNDKIHEILYTPENTPGYFTFAEAYKRWCRSDGKVGVRGANAWDHWWLLNFFAYEDAAWSDCPECSLPVFEGEGCSACENREWLFI